MSVDVQAQEVRRQALLHHMQHEVWLPRQSLPFAAPSRDFLLEWGDEVEQSAPVEQAVQDQTVAPATAAPRTQQAQSQLQQIRQTLAGNTAAEEPSAQPEEKPQAQEQEAIQPPTPAVEIPRFALQLLRSGNCLLLLDLPVAEPLQARDPEYLLLKDMLRAAKVSHEPSQLFNAEPIRWPLLTAGDFTSGQDADSARTYVRELLFIEAARQPTQIIWLLGDNAVRFANQADEFADEFGLTAFQNEVQLWSLPSLEQLLQQPKLKSKLWQSMQQRMLRWVQHD